MPLEDIPEPVQCSAVLSRFRLFTCLWMTWVHTYRAKMKKNSFLEETKLNKVWRTEQLSYKSFFSLQLFSYYIATIHLPEPSWRDNRDWFAQVIQVLFNFIRATFKGNSFIPSWSWKSYNLVVLPFLERDFEWMND